MTETRTTVKLEGVNELQNVFINKKAGYLELPEQPRNHATNYTI